MAEDGTWSLRSREGTELRQDSAGAMKATFGCHPQTGGAPALPVPTPPAAGDALGPGATRAPAAAGWRPATYSADSCWGPTPHTSCGPEDASREVVVRSAADPYVAAEELTDSSLDFGLSPHSKRVYGLTILALGVFFLMPPGIVVCEWLYKRRRRRAAKEDRVPLGSARGTWYDSRDASIAGIYGHSRV
ncbi:unnamed protein product [Prorocentrum cordatum]|uniref:Uncharacterized protein n=1 Tax=Prorocentrum cordatum TaxID=2364126 RepID=A0ABN9VKK0_9DINO|nr:unnamed protein product [Polarella glacialis]